MACVRVACIALCVEHGREVMSGYFEQGGVVVRLHVHLCIPLATVVTPGLLARWVQAA